jgi:hypothetical protein
LQLTPDSLRAGNDKPLLLLIVFSANNFAHCRRVSFVIINLREVRGGKFSDRVKQETMLLDVIIDGQSVSVRIDDPHRPDLEMIFSEIERFTSSKETEIEALDIKGLISAMIRGIVGCERGCPANAKYLESVGHKGFTVRYVEGGVLTANIKTGDQMLSLRMFPDF